MIRNIILNGKALTYELERKMVKNLNLRIRRDGSIHVSAPQRVSIAQIEDFLIRNAEFIINALEKTKDQPAGHSCCEGELFPLLGDWLPLQLTEGERASCDCDGVNINVTVRDTSDKAKVRKTLESFYRRECEKAVTESCKRIYPYFEKLNIPFPVIKYRYMKSKWGSCCPSKNTLTFNCCLVYAPVKCIDYVVAHEFTHFLHPDHSKAFYAELDKLIPEHKARRARLNEFASELPK